MERPITAGSEPRGVLQRISRAYFLAVVGLACAVTILLVGIMGVQVFYRYVLNDSLIWAEEICRYLLILMTFLFAGAAFQRGEMISVELVIGQFRGWARLVFIVPAYLLALALLVALTYYGYRFASLNAISTIPAFDFIWAGLAGDDSTADVSMYWLYLSLPVGLAIMAVHFAIALCRQIQHVWRGDTAQPADVAAGNRIVPGDE